MKAFGRRGVARLMAALLLVLTIVLVGVELSWYVSPDVHRRFWSDIFERGGGPMAARFIIQPAMAIAFAVYDGLKDTRLRDEFGNRTRTTDGLISTSRIVLLGLCVDAIYQLTVLDNVYPGEALMVTLPLILTPYFLVRWCIRHLGPRRLSRDH